MDEFVKETPLQDRHEVERRAHRRLFGIILLPIAFFPLLSLITYNWRDISLLNAPPLTPPANLIGLAGAWSVFFGYHVFGLVLWIVPFLVLGFSILLLYGKIATIGRKMAWMFLFLIAMCCLVQMGSETIFDSTLETLNSKPNAGGAIGYWLMNCLLCRWFSPVGGGILMISIMLFTLMMVIGIRNIVYGLGRMTEWWVERQARRKSERESLDASIAAEERPKIKALDPQSLKDTAKRAKEEAKKAREQERQRKATDYDVEAVTPAPQPDPPPARLPVQAAALASKVVSVPDMPHQSLADYPMPPISLLNPIPKGTADHGNIEDIEKIIIETLQHQNVAVEVVNTIAGPVVTQYELRPAPHIKVEKISSLQGNLQMALEAKSIRIEAPIPGKNAVGIEIPNRRARPVTFREILEGQAWKKNTCEIPLVLGKDVAGNDLIYDLTKAPHLLVAGATGSGKSVCLNAILAGILMSRTPEQLRLILVDPKRVEFTAYNDLPHLLVPVINDSKRVAFGLRWAIIEMDKRYKLLQKAGCRNIVSFNTRTKAMQADLFSGDTQEGAIESLPEKLPYIVIVVDEVADIMATVGKEVEPAIARLTSLSRAVGIHLILATQRPSVDVITGTIKANIPGRIAFKVSQSNDSRTILDCPGAEELIGRGDMLFLKEGSQLQRAQGAWVDDSEIARVVAFVKEHCNPCYDQTLMGKMDRIKELDPNEALEAGLDDSAAPSGAAAGCEVAGTVDEDSDEAMANKALDVIRMTRRASTTMLQRRMRIGYTRAARLMDILETRGIVAPQGSTGAGAREILIDLDAIIPSHPNSTNTTTNNQQADEDGVPGAGAASTTETI
ncbi:MAG: DNA translocase FtsK 4TM domain-containing protein [bacterium]